MRPIPFWPAALLAASLLSAASAVAGPAADQLKGSIESIQAILLDPGLKGRAEQRREKLREIVHARFDFAEMAKRSLGPHWQKRTAEEQKEFVGLFTQLLENSYLDTIEAYNGEKIRYGNERRDGNFAEVDTRIVDPKGQEFSVNYRLQQSNGAWKVIDVVIENVSLVSNYRSQFNRLLARSSYRELVQAMKEKKLSAPGAST